MDDQTYRPMTKPSQKRKTFAEHNYNYANRPQTTQTSRTNPQKHLFSQRQNFQHSSSNSINIHDYPQISQDQSENYPFFQQQKKLIYNKKKDSKLLIIHLINYHQMTMTIINQRFFAPYTQEHHMRQPRLNLESQNNIFYSQNPTSTQSYQPLQMQNTVSTQSYQPVQMQNTSSTHSYQLTQMQIEIPLP